MPFAELMFTSEQSFSVQDVKDALSTEQRPCWSLCDGLVDELPSFELEELPVREIDHMCDGCAPLKKKKIKSYKMNQVVSVDEDGFACVGRRLRLRRSDIRDLDVEPEYPASDFPVFEPNYFLKKRYMKVESKSVKSMRRDPKFHMKSNKDVKRPGPDYFLLNVPLDGDPVAVPPAAVSEFIVILRRLDVNIQNIAFESRNHFDTHVVVLQFFVLLILLIIGLLLLMSNLDILNPGPKPELDPVPCYGYGYDSVLGEMKLIRGQEKMVCMWCKSILSPFCPAVRRGVHKGCVKYTRAKHAMSLLDFQGYVKHAVEPPDESEFCEEEVTIAEEESSKSKKTVWKPLVTVSGPPVVGELVIGRDVAAGPCTSSSLNCNTSQAGATGVVSAVEITQEPVPTVVFPSNRVSLSVQTETTYSEVGTELPRGDPHISELSDPQVEELSKNAFSVNVSCGAKMPSISSSPFDPALPFGVVDGCATLLTELPPEGSLNGECLFLEEVCQIFGNVASIPFGYFMDKVVMNRYLFHVSKNEDRLISKRNVSRVDKDYVVATAFAPCPWWLNIWMWLTWHKFGLFMLLLLVTALILPVICYWLPALIMWPVKSLMLLAFVANWVYTSCFYPFHWRAYFTLSYAPHLAATVAGEYDRPTTAECAKANVRTKVSSPSFPLKDLYDWTLSRGTEIAVLMLLSRTDFYLMGLRTGCRERITSCP